MGNELKYASILAGRRPHIIGARRGSGDECVVVSACDQCGRRAPQLHVVGGRAYCPRCCPACARGAIEAQYEAAG